MMYGIIELWDNAAVLAALGGLISALRVAANSPNKGLRAKVWDVAVSVVMAVGAAEYLVGSEVPRLSLVVGLVAGGVCDSLLDAIRALSPKAAGGLVEGWLGKFGYTRPPEPEPVRAELPEEPPDEGNV